MNVSDLKNRVYVYGLDDKYRMVRYSYLTSEHFSITELTGMAVALRANYPEIESVYAIDNGYDVYHACLDARKSNSIEDRALFKILLDTKGIRII